MLSLSRILATSLWQHTHRICIPHSPSHSPHLSTFPSHHPTIRPSDHPTSGKHNHVRMRACRMPGGRARRTFVCFLSVWNSLWVSSLLGSAVLTGHSMATRPSGTILRSSTLQTQFFSTISLHLSPVLLLNRSHHSTLDNNGRGLAPKMRQPSSLVQHTATATSASSTQCASRHAER